MRERLLEQSDRLVGLAEEEVQAAEVVRELADVNPVRELLVRRARLLGVRAREHPVSFAVGDERRLEVGGADRARIVRVLGELERPLDVLARRLVVALATPAARAPREDVRAKRVAREAGALREREGLVQQAERGLDAVELVAADAERVEHLGALEIGEAAGLDDAARLVEEVERLAQRAEAHLGAAGAEERARLELGEPGRPRGRHEQVVLGGAFVVVPRLEQRLRARRAASRRPRSSVATPLARKPGSTPSRAASHSTVSRVGRVLPRSICETYSFENRSPASSLWVSPAATRSWRRRSPSRSPLGAAARLVRRAVSWFMRGIR